MNTAITTALALCLLAATTAQASAIQRNECSIRADIAAAAYQAPEGMPPRDFRISVFEKCISSNYLKETQ